MRHAFRIASVVAMSCAVAACGLLKRGGAADAGADAGVSSPATPDAEATEPADATMAPVATSSAAAPPASNVDDIARFPDETKLDSVSATTKRWVTVREAPQTGKPVVSINAGTTVTEISQRKEYFLVLVDHPREKDSAQKLMGWIHQDAFTPLVDAGADGGLRAITCPKGETPLFSDGMVCARICMTDSECPSGQSCKGSAQMLTKELRPAQQVSVCTVTPPAPSGLGRGPKLQSVDGGAPPTPSASGAVIPVPTADVVDPTSGACAPNYLLVKDGKCHKKCPSFDCQKATQFCISCNGQKVCSANRDLCK